MNIGGGNLTKFTALDATESVDLDVKVMGDQIMAKNLLTRSFVITEC